MTDTVKVPATRMLSMVALERDLDRAEEAADLMQKEVKRLDGIAAEYDAHLNRIRHDTGATPEARARAETLFWRVFDFRADLANIGLE